MSFQSSVSKEELSQELSNFLSENNYGNTNIRIDKNKEEIKLKINAKLKNDLLVRELSDDIQNFLISNTYIPNSDAIQDWVVIGPSVGSYMQNTALMALIFGIVAMSIYMIFSFGTVRKFIPPTILVAVVVTTTLLDISIPLGAYGIWMSIDPTIQVDSVFIIAILTII